MIPSLADQLSTELDALRLSSRLRTCQALEGTSRTNIRLQGRPYISFSSNDYLGLASDPRLQIAAWHSAQKSGFGAGASRLLAGTNPEHLALEAAIAAFLSYPSALLFPTGYQANLGVITALAGPDDLIVADRAVHASILDGCRLSRAKLAVYPHLDASIAQQHLSRLGPTKRRRFLITESLFSMDGDTAPLQDLALIAQSNDTALIVDEAHAIGCLGPSGRGLCAECGVQPDILIGTFGKAFGTCGAFVAGSLDLRAYLVNRARTFIFTTGLPAHLAAATNAALRIISSPEGDNLRSHLAQRSAQLRTALGLPTGRLPSPIIPLIIGPDDKTLHASAHLQSQGFFVQPIRPPTVRIGTSRLRITLSSSHSREQVTQLHAAIESMSQQPYSPAVSFPTSTMTNPQSSETPSHRQQSNEPARGLFLLGTDTNVGKTSVALALLQILVSRGSKPVPFKPVETGARPSPSDASILLSASRRTDIPLSVVCPFPFQEPIAPAAANTGDPLTLALLLSHAKHAATYGSPLIVESAGGLLSPYSTNLTSLDLAVALGYPVLLVARNGLGTINHTTLSVREIRRRSVPFLGTILVTTSACPTPDQKSNLALIAAATGQQPLGLLPYLPSATPENLAKAMTTNINIAELLARVLI